MFHIFSGNKPKLSDLIPAGFTDIHSHVLPNIDDGCKNMKESISLINEIKNFGISKIYATPHTYPGLYDNTNIGIINSYKELSKENKNDIIINYASEYLLDPSLIYKAKEKTLLTLKNNYVLVEMSFFSAPNMLHEILFEIQINGYKPILAHPERYRFLFNDINNYYKLKNLGCSFQINLFSLTGYYGSKVVEICDKLLKENLVDYYGSDIHSLGQIGEFDKKVKIKEVQKVKKNISNNELFS